MVETVDGLWSQDAEQSVIGCVLLDQRVIDGVFPLTAEHFYHPAHKTVWEAIVALWHSRQIIDTITVNEQLGAESERIGGLTYLSLLMQSVPSARGAKRYAEIVRDKAARRSLVDAMRDAVEKASGQTPLADVIESAGSAMAAIQRGNSVKAPRHIADIAIERTEHYEALQRGDVEPGWSTGLQWLDDRLNGGVKPGKVYFVAARPSVGKTSVSLQIVAHLARSGKRALVLSQEMPEEEIADRVTANAGRVNYGRMQTGAMNDEDWGRAVDALESLRLADLFVSDKSGLTIGDIRALVRSVQGCKVLMLDYLQLCSKASSSSASNRNSEIEEISRGLKSMAMELGMAVIVLSQLNRECEKRPGKRPIMADLRDSGSIEQDADVVMLLWPLRDLSEGVRLIGCDIAKNRQGQRGDVALEFTGAIQHWQESSQPITEESFDQPRKRGFGNA